MINKIASAVVMWSVLLWATSAFSAEPGHVEVKLHAFKVAADNKLLRVTEARPGDVIEYQVTYRNTGTAPATQVHATLPVPPGGMAYLEGTAVPAEVQASVDGEHFAPTPLKRNVLRNGKQVNDIVPPSEYRALRWRLGDLAPGQTVIVSARMRLADGAEKKS